MFYFQMFFVGCYFKLGILLCNDNNFIDNFFEFIFTLCLFLRHTKFFLQICNFKFFAFHKMVLG
jgi:hypothetical protein